MVRTTLRARVGVRSPGARVVAIAITVALGAGLVAASTPAGAATGKVGAQPPGQGLGSKAALAQSTCDKARERTNFTSIGTGPFCVNPWKDGAKNGGATANGVTATDVKVVVYTPTETQLAAQRAAGTAGPVNQLTGQPGNYRDNFRDTDTVYQHAVKTFGTYQLWGRNPVYEYVEASGTDEAAQRADALAVIAKKPFIVIDAFHQSAGAPIFESEIAKAKIILNGAAATSLTQVDLQKQAPYRWATQSDSTASLYLVSSFLGTITSGKAEYAGDPGLQGKKRAFGLITPQGSIDVDLLKAQLKENGVSTPASEVTYDATATATFNEVAKTYIAKMQSDGATSVILFANQAMINALMIAATANNFNPEWIVTGYQFSDYDGYARNWPQDQAAHAFGVGVLNPLITGISATTNAFNWYWGTKQGTVSAGVQSWVGFIYAGINYAGPKLTVENFKKGFFSVPAVGGASNGTTTFQTGYGRTVGLPYDEYFGLGTDVAMIWYNPNISGGANAVASALGKGKWMYLDGGKRFSFGSFPKGAKFFDTATAVAEVPSSQQYVGGIAPAPNPCSGCPSTSSQ